MLWHDPELLECDARAAARAMSRRPITSHLASFPRIWIARMTLPAESSAVALRALAAYSNSGRKAFPFLRR